MRAIRISTDVFAAIWKRRQDGELNEDAILGRILGVAVAKNEEQFDKGKYQRLYMRGYRTGKRGDPKDSNEDEYLRGYQAGQALKGQVRRSESRRTRQRES